MVLVDWAADSLCEKHNRPLGRSLRPLSSRDGSVLRQVTSAIAMETIPTERFWCLGGGANESTRVEGRARTRNRFHPETGNSSTGRGGQGMFSMEWFRLDGHNAFVTGAGSGIGQGIAIGLAQAGANVACLDVPGSAG